MKLLKMANYRDKVFRKVNKTKKRKQQQKDLKDAIDDFLELIDESITTFKIKKYLEKD